jgi:hypothetical protein
MSGTRQLEQEFLLGQIKLGFITAAFGIDGVYG